MLDLEKGINYIYPDIFEKGNNYIYPETKTITISIPYALYRVEVTANDL